MDRPKDNRAARTGSSEKKQQPTTQPATQPTKTPTTQKHSSQNLKK